MLSRTPVAGVPFILKSWINRATRHRCMTAVGGGGYAGGRFWEQPDALFGNLRAVQKLVDWSDAVLVHNGRIPRGLRLAGRRVAVMYHSEPHNVDRGLERAGAPTAVIAQGHALLYPGLPVLPNLVDIWDERFMPDPARNAPNGRAVLGYAPSNRHGVDYMRRNRYSPKGWPETMPVLKKLEAQGVIELRVWENVPFNRCMAERKACHIMLDEVITGSYHRCTLEACSQGQVALNGISEEVREVLARVTGSGGIGWVRTPLNALEDVVRELVVHPAKLADQMSAARGWMESIWNPEPLWIGFYEPLLLGGPAA